MIREKVNFRKVLHNKNAEGFITDLKKQKVPFSVRKGSDAIELYVDDTHYMFASKESFPRNKIYLFNTVNVQCKKWLKENELKMPKKAKMRFYNYDYDAKKGYLTATDLNHAYWRIAYLNGFITEKTYLAGLPKKCKRLRLATLSILGREKKFEEYENGEKVREVVYKEKDVELRRMFEFIMHTCWNYGKDLKKLLGNEIYSWNVDCVYYRDTKENRKIVHDYFDSKNISYKQLVY